MEVEAEPDASRDDADHGPGSPPRARFVVRSPRDRYLAGLAGGFGERYAIDPFLLRAALLATTLFAAYAAGWVPIVPAIYTVLWLTVPGPSGRSALRNIGSGDGRREVLAAIAAFVVIAVLLSRPSFAVALAFAALAWVLLADRDLRTPSIEEASLGAKETAHAASAPDVRPSGGESAPVGPLANASDSAVQRAATWGRRRRADRGDTIVQGFSRPRRVRREPPLWPLTVSLLAGIAVVGFTIEAVSGVAMDPAVVVNLALVAIGGVLLLSAWRGRAGWTILLALALIPAWVGFSVADIGRFAGTGSVRHVPTAIPSSGALEYELGYGEMTIDLRELPLEDGDRIRVDVGASGGAVTVIAPPSAQAVVRSHIGFGTSTTHSYGLDFYDYDREPHLDRTTRRTYPARGTGCITGYWSEWETMLAMHEQAGVDFDGLGPTERDNAELFLAAIVEAGFAEPTPVEQAEQYGYAPGTVFDADGNPRTVSLDELVPVFPETEALTPPEGTTFYFDEFGNRFIGAESVDGAPPDAVVSQEPGLLTWSYTADRTGLPCIPQPASDDPPVIEIDATVGLGTLEIDRDEY